MKVARSSGIVVNHALVNTESSSLGPADLSGWVIAQSGNVVIMNTSVANFGDSVTLLASEQVEYHVPCILIHLHMLSSESTNVLVSDLVHFGGGITIGPLGKVPGEVDNVENITIRYVLFDTLPQRWQTISLIIYIY